MKPGTRRSRRTRAVFLLLFSILLTAGVAKLASSSPSHPASGSSAAARPTFVKTRCADVIVFGLRGSGQSPTRNAGTGEEVLRSVRSMSARLHTRSAATVRLEAVRYQAAYTSTWAGYMNGVADGQRKLGSQFRRLSRDCKDSKFAFVGFSQGAQAVHQFSSGLSAKQARKVALIAMIADPRRDPADTIAHWAYGGEFTKREGKLGAGPKFDASTHRKAITFCAPKDEVCNRPKDGGPSRLSETHRMFYEKAANVRSTGEHLDAVLRRNGVS